MLVRITDNFLANLADIEQFLQAVDASDAYDNLLDDLQNTIITNLEGHPQIGRLFLQRQPLSIEGFQRHEKLLKKSEGADLREYIHSDYLILYAIHRETVHLLSIRHHKQLSFDLIAFWPNQQV